MNPVVVSSIICPTCHAELPADAEHCSRCGSSLRCPHPPTEDQPGELARILDRPWLIIVLVLHVGFLGIPLYWKTSYSVQTRLLISLISIVYTVFAVAVIAWGVMQLMRLFSG